jgi:hypothetical protein
MNKLTKIGLSALCGSLASISAANAGPLEVTGSATATWTSFGGQVTGNPIGMASSMTFTGNGELDGGQTFAVGIVHKNKGAYSTADITLNTNSAGTFELSSGDGGQGIGGYDDNMPTAWEEVWGTGITTNVNLQKGVAGSTNVSWTSPKVVGTTIHVAYAPDNDGSTSANKAVSGNTSEHFGAGWDIVLDAGTQNGEINLFIGASETDVAKGGPGFTKPHTGDHNEGVIGLQFKMGPVELGGQISGERVRTQARNSTSYYGNTSWGIAFNVNDDLSVSYSQARHLQTKTKKASTSGINNGTEEYTPKSWMRGDSIQVAYSIGGVSLKYAQTEYDNTLYGFDTKTPRENRIVAVSLAF